MSALESAVYLVSGVTVLLGAMAIAGAGLLDVIRERAVPLARARAPWLRRVLVTLRRRRAAPHSAWVVLGRRAAIDALARQLSQLAAGITTEQLGAAFRQQPSASLGPRIREERCPRPCPGCTAGPSCPYCGGVVIAPPTT